MSGNTLFVFAGSAVVAIGAGLLIRWLALEHGASLTLALLDFTTDLFAAAAAVFPTTLILQHEGGQQLTMSVPEVLGTFMLVVVIAVWAKFDTRYFAYWRKGMRRHKKSDNTLDDGTLDDNPRRWRAIAFVVGNGLGFAVLYASTALSQSVVT
jgi:hypothetical protein